MSSIVIKGNTSGQVEIAAPDVAGSTTLTLPANTGNIVTTGDSGTVTQGMVASGVAGTGPAFKAYANAAQTLTFTGGYIKVNFDAEVFDTDNCWDTSTSRFTPTVAGYYQFNVLVSSGNVGLHGVFLKNGSAYAYGTNHSTSNHYSDNNNTLIYLNGSTDYVEYAEFVSATTTLTTGSSNGPSHTYFTGHLVRAG